MKTLALNFFCLLTFDLIIIPGKVFCYLGLISAQKSICSCHKAWANNFTVFCLYCPFTRYIVLSSFCELPCKKPLICIHPKASRLLFGTAILGKIIASASPADAKLSFKWHHIIAHCSLQLHKRSCQKGKGKGGWAEPTQSVIKHSNKRTIIYIEGGTCISGFTCSVNKSNLLVRSKQFAMK